MKTKDTSAVNNLSEAAIYCKTPESISRVLILGAGQAAMQVADILLHDPSCQLVGFLDDNPDMQGQDVFGFPVLGGLSQLEELFLGMGYQIAEGQK